MAEVFAGFVAGYAMAVVSTPLLSVLLLRLRAESAVLDRLLPVGVSAVSVSVLLHGALVMFWTGFGLLLGLTLLAMRHADGALGSLNAPFTLFVVGLLLALGAPLFALLVPLRRLIAITLVAALFLFGWLMPYMAEWSRFDS
jgi:hypothetical protein